MSRKGRVQTMEYNIVDIIQEYEVIIRHTVNAKIPELDAEDVMQEIWTGVWKSLAGFRGGSAMNTWLFHIVSNKIADYYRETGTRQERRRLAEDVNIAMRNTERRVDNSDLIPTLLPVLPEQYSKIIEQVYMYGMTYAEIAEVECKNYEAVRSMCRRAIDYIISHEMVEFM